MANIQKRPIEAIGGLYSPIPHSVLDSVAFMGASYPSKALVFDLIRQHNGKNNGHLQLSYTWLRKRGWKSRDVIQRARAELIARNLICQTRQGGLNIGASRYAVTWLAISNYVGLDITAKGYAQGAWVLLDQIPLCKNANAIPRNGTGNTARRYTTSPLNGTAKALPVP